MKLSEFIKTETYWYADCTEYINKQSEEIDNPEEELMDVEVLSYHTNGGFLEIELDI